MKLLAQLAGGAVVIGCAVLLGRVVVAEAPPKTPMVHDMGAAGGGEGAHVLLDSSQLQWKPGPNSLPAGWEVAMLEGDMSKAGLFTARARFPAGYIIPPHWHPADEHVTVITGTLHMGMGDTLDKSKGQELTAGGFALMPARSHHYAWSEKGAVIQLHGMGPWGITYLNAGDDPRKK